METEEIDPQNAAREVISNIGQFEWIPDRIGIAPEFMPQFSDTDVVQLREARRVLHRDIDYLGASLPQPADFPDSTVLLEVHRGLVRFEQLRQVAAGTEIPALADATPETLSLAQHLLTHLESLQQLRSEVVQAQRPWTVAIHDRLRWGGNDMLVPILEALGAELNNVAERRRAFLERPVATPAGIELDTEIVEAVSNLSAGRNPFGLTGLFGRAVQKRQLDIIRVLGNPPANAESWQHVADYLAMLKRMHELASRWNALAPELQLESVPSHQPEGWIAAAEVYDLIVKVKAVVMAEKHLCGGASRVFPNWDGAPGVAADLNRQAELEEALRHHITQNRLANNWTHRERFQEVLEGRTGRVVEDIRNFLDRELGDPGIEDVRVQVAWSALMAELSRVLGLSNHLATVREVCEKIEASGAPDYAEALKQSIDGTVDGLLPDNSRSAWRLKRLATYLESIDEQEALKRLVVARHGVVSDLSRAYRDIVVKRTWLKLAENASRSIRAALQAYLNAIQKIGKGTGKRAVFLRQDARMAASQANTAVPCWIMPHYRVSESLPAELGCFDLVIIDEASQSDLTALPSLLRAEKVLIVGDDKQVSPDGVGLQVLQCRNLMSRFLGNQVEIYRQQMDPARSIYDLFKVVFANSSVMLKEHFRCVGPIIEYSKREFYNNEIRPLRLPKASERLDPPLIDVVVEDGNRQGEVNKPEARFIVDEIKKIVSDPNMSRRSIGVVSLLADKQALLIWERLAHELEPEVMQRHRITCGDARTFQGKERDIMFLSMVSAPNDVGAPLSRDTFAQRFNVAASRARDRMYLVRSVELGDLSEADRLRRSLIAHFATPFAQDEKRVEDQRTLCYPGFECEMYDELTQRGYWVTPQVRVGHYRIDMVVEGHNDARLAIECDGDRYHGPDKWADDMQRQRVLERAGWVFWRCFASAFIRRRQDMLADLVKTLTERGIEPIGAEGAPRSVHTEHRKVSSLTVSAGEQGIMMVHGDIIETPMASIPKGPPPQARSARGDAPSVGVQLHLSTGDGDLFGHAQPVVASVKVRDASLSLTDYVAYAGIPGSDPRTFNEHSVSEGIVRIVAVEGPMVAKRTYDIYLGGCGIKRMDHELKSSMNKALAHAIRERSLVSEDETAKGGLLFSVIRVSGSPPIKLRTRGPRSFEEIPPSELQVVAKYLMARHRVPSGSEEHLRRVLEYFDLDRPTPQAGTMLREVLGKSFPYVDEFLSGMRQ